jgi:hypothetical protein
MVLVRVELFHCFGVALAINAEALEVKKVIVFNSALDLATTT